MFDFNFKIIIFLTKSKVYPWKITSQKYIFRYNLMTFSNETKSYFQYIEKVNCSKQLDSFIKWHFKSLKLVFAGSIKIFSKFEKKVVQFIYSTRFFKIRWKYTVLFSSHIPYWNCHWCIGIIISLVHSKPKFSINFFHLSNCDMQLLEKKCQFF